VTGGVPAEGDERQFGDVRVQTTARRRLTHAVTTTFQIRPTDRDDVPSRTVRQYEFADWPVSGRGVPSTPLHFAEFVQTVRMSSRDVLSGVRLDPLLVLRSTHDQHSGIGVQCGILSVRPSECVPALITPCHHLKTHYFQQAFHINTFLLRLRFGFGFFTYLLTYNNNARCLPNMRDLSD